MNYLPPALLPPAVTHNAAENTLIHVSMCGRVLIQFCMDSDEWTCCPKRYYI